MWGEGREQKTEETKVSIHTVSSGSIYKEDRFSQSMQN